MATIAGYTQVQYSGIWSLSGQANAQGAGTWASPPVPHLFVWGYNPYGGLGLGNLNKYSSPKQVGSLTNWSSVSNAANAVKTDGTLWTWGYNADGQLGLGNSGAGTYKSSPTQVGTLTNWSQALRTAQHSLAVKTDGTLWAWGQNLYGQLGLGNRTSYSSPKQIGALTTWLSIGAGRYVSFAIKTDGTLWSWGYNVYGQLGLGNVTYYSSPKQVGSLTNWSKISGADGNFTIAIKTDGTLWAWGYNGYGQLGINNVTRYSSPKQVGSLTTWSLALGAGNDFSLAVKTDGTLWAWGANGLGQLGLGNQTYYSSPKQVGSLTTWSKIAGSIAAAAAIRTDGTLWSWGYNDNGQLGVGNVLWYSSPKQVGSLTTWTDVYGGYNVQLFFGIART